MVIITTQKANLSAPWFTYVKEVEALFERDPDIGVRFYEEHMELYLYVADNDKANALAWLLPAEKEFGNVVLKITIVNSKEGEEDTVTIIKRLFHNNEAVSFVETLPRGAYVVFKKDVVQFFNDQTDDINGKKNTLYQDIAKDVFGGVPGVYFCTE